MTDAYSMHREADGRCDRCGADEGCERYEGYTLCPSCASSVKGAVRSFVECFDPECSSIYVQLSRRQVAHIRDEARTGHMANIISMTPDQMEQIMGLFGKLDDYGLGLVDERGGSYTEPGICGTDGGCGIWPDSP